MDLKSISFINNNSGLTIKMNKKIILILFAVFLLSLNFVSAVDISLDNYYPTPAEAGDYFNAKLSITNKDEITTDASIKFKPSYPFSLDPGEDEEVIIDNLGPGSTVTRNFKIRVDAGAKEGDNSLIFQYKDCPGCVWKEKNVLVTVMEAQTMFDVVLQELNAEGVFIAIANIGKNPANAVTVRIPEQEYFKTKLISAQIVGNLESGDYTLVGFQILPKSEQQVSSGQQLSRENRQQNVVDIEKELFIQIDYTDPLGIRRSITEKVLLSPSALSKISSESATSTASNLKSQRTSTWKNTWFWVSLILIIVLLRNKILKLYRRLRHKF